MLTKGTLIARIESTSIDNSISTLQNQISAQKANLEKQKSILNNLLNTPTSETVNVSRKEVEITEENVKAAEKKLDVARNEIEVAKQQLDSQVVTAKNSATKALRYQQLYRNGVIVEQQYDDAKTLAETDRIQVEQLNTDVASKQSDLKTVLQDVNVAMSGFTAVCNQIKYSQVLQKRDKNEALFPRPSREDCQCYRERGKLFQKNCPTVLGE